MPETMQATETQTPTTLITYGAFALTSLGVTVTGTPGFDEWANVLAWAQKAEQASQFWIGDLLTYGEAAYGEKYAQAIQSTGLSYQTLANAAWVAKAVPVSIRREHVPFSHHMAVAALPTDQQAQWLATAEEEDLTREELKSRIKQARADVDAEPSVFWLTIGCTSAEEQSAMAEKFKAEGRAIKLH